MHQLLAAVAAFSKSTRSCRAPIAIALAMSALATMIAAAPPAERQLAPGVLTTIPPNLNPEETVSTHDLVEVRSNPALDWKPDSIAATQTLRGMSDQTKFRREIYCLEFAFKPIRLIDVDLPLAAGQAVRKRVWYLLYRVRNTGQTLKPVQGEDGLFTATPAKGGPVRFSPQFVLEAQDRQKNGARVSKAYLDRVIPAAVAAISRRETPGYMLHSTADISQQPIPAGQGRIDRGVWGVATWIDVDPRIDFFSVYVGGLTNAYRWTDNAAGFHVGDAPGKGRQFVYKTLQINFWRPGDNIDLNEREFRYGVPLDKAALYGVHDGVAYQWLYR
jgi:hypothetical protein